MISNLGSSKLRSNPFATSAMPTLASDDNGVRRHRQPARLDVNRRRQHEAGATERGLRGGAGNASARGLGRRSRRNR